MSAKRFKTTVAKSGSKTFVELPFNPDEVWGEKQRHYVSGSVNGCTYRGLIESDEGRFCLSLGAAWRRDNGLEAGAKVEVVLAPEGPLSGNVSPDVAAALAAQAKASAFFDSLPTFYRNNYIRWIESAKRPETRAARIAELIRLLKAEKRER